MSGIVKGVKKAFKSVGKFVKKYWRQIVIAAAIVFTAGIATVGVAGFSSAAAAAGGGVGGFMSAAGSTMVAGVASIGGTMGIGSGVTASTAGGAFAAAPAVVGASAAGGGATLLTGAAAQGLGLAPQAAAGAQAAQGVSALGAPAMQSAATEAVGAAAGSGAAGAAGGAAGATGGAVAQGGGNAVAAVGGQASRTGFLGGLMNNQPAMYAAGMGIQSYLGAQQAEADREYAEELYRRQNRALWGVPLDDEEFAAWQAEREQSQPAGEPVSDRIRRLGLMGVQQPGTLIRLGGNDGYA